MDFRDQLEYRMASGISTEKHDRSLIDGLFATSEIEFGRKLASKKDFEKADFLKMMDLNFGKELKLYNLNERERYILGKFATIFLSDIFKMTEEMLDYNISKSHNNLSISAKKMFEECISMTKRYARWTSETFYYWARSSLSLGLKGFLEALKQKFEVNYPTQQGANVEIQK